METKKKKQVKKKWYHILQVWLPVVIWCGVIFFFSSLPTIETPFIYWWDVITKKSAHVIEYGVLFLLTYRALARSLSHRHHKEKKRINNQYIKIALMFCMVYAISDEYHQSFVPGRQPSARDVAIDLIGMGIAIWGLKKHQQIATKFL